MSYKHTAEDLSEVFPSRAESITAALQDAGKQSVDSVRKHKNQVRAGETKLETPHFLHLRDVRYLSAGSRTQASLWRAHP